MPPRHGLYPDAGRLRGHPLGIGILCARESAHEVWELTVTNTGDTPRELTLTGYAEFTNHSNYEQDQVNLQYPCLSAAHCLRAIASPSRSTATWTPSPPTNWWTAKRNRAVLWPGRCGGSQLLRRQREFSGPLPRLRRSPGRGIRRSGQRHQLQRKFLRGTVLRGETGPPAKAAPWLSFWGMKSSEEARRPGGGLRRPRRPLRRRGTSAERRLVQPPEPPAGAHPRRRIQHHDQHLERLQLLYHLCVEPAASFIYCGLRNGYGYRTTVQDIQGIIHLEPAMAKEKIRFMLSAQVDNGGRPAAGEIHPQSRP